MDAINSVSGYGQISLMVARGKMMSIGEVIIIVLLEQVIVTNVILLI
jgi:hypothetical protein